MSAQPNIIKFAASGSGSAARRAIRVTPGLRENPMRKLSFFAIVMTLLSAGTSAWIGGTTQTSVLSPAHAQIDPLQLMIDARSLPTERVVDYSLVFE